MVVVDTYPPLGGIINDEPTGGYTATAKEYADTVLGASLILDPATRLGEIASILATTRRAGRVQEPKLSGRDYETKRGGRFP